MAARIQAASLVLLGSLAAAAPVQAQGREHDHHSGREEYRIDARRAARAPVIDGVLDDPVWQSAAMLDGFTQQEPNDGAPATERTEVRILYDAGNLYIGLHAFDSSPSGGLMRRTTEWKISGVTHETNVNQEILDEWVAWMVITGFENDCQFDGWGAALA
jgi:hypothetical protein